MTPRRAPASMTPKDVSSNPVLLTVFLVSLVLPLFFFLGPLRLSPYRLVLLVMVVPLFFAWLGDRTQKKLLCDWLIVFYVMWSGLAMMVTMGVGAAIQPLGMQFIETCGAYFLARRCVRDAESYEYVVRWFFRIVLILLPFALFETLTARNIALDLFRVAGPVFHDVYKEPRWGFDRVQGPFEHPILFGVFCGATIGMVAFLNDEVRPRLWRMGVVFITALWSLSSGPLTGIIVQMATVGYERTTRGIAKRWHMIGGAVAAGFVAIDALSNRSPFEVFISYFAFNTHTAYNRMLIWHFGSQSVMKHPWFGLGTEPDWERPDWMSPSADMFWLLKNMQFGLPAGLALVGAFLYIVVKACRERTTDARINACRTGLLISLLGLFASGWATHYWNATYVLIIFLFGCGVWIFDRDPSNASASLAAPEQVDEAPKRPRTIL